MPLLDEMRHHDPDHMRRERTVDVGIAKQSTRPFPRPGRFQHEMVVRRAVRKDKTSPHLDLRYGRLHIRL